MAHASHQENRLVHVYRRLIALCTCGALLALGVATATAAVAGGSDAPPAAATATALSPAVFLPGGMLGLQIGSPWASTRKNAALGRLTCQQTGTAGSFDEVCFFKMASRVAGAEIHDGFIARKGDRVVLIGTGIAIKDADDPLAESVMRNLEARVHAGYQHTGSNVLFVNMPQTHMSAGELAGFAETAPVLLVELEPTDRELAVFYGYLAPVNAFSALTAN
jgi:hypothetical protein